MAAQFTVYKKKGEELDEYAAKGGARKKKGKSPAEPRAATPPPEHPEEPSFFPKKEEKKAAKFVPLFSKDGREADVVKLAGRHACECQAVKHNLVSNCLACGRIVCSQEGSGPCLYCGALVVTRAEQEVLDRKSKKSEQLLKKLGGGDQGREQYQASEQKALAAKERLLEYDANSTKRTQVIDDESDYFATDSNKWLTPQQREALEKKKAEVHDERHKSRLDRRITFDFAGRRVVEEEAREYDIQQDTKLLELFKDDAFSVNSEIKRRAEEGCIANPNSKTGRPVYNETVGGRGLEGRAPVAQAAGRVQDGGLLEMSDMGRCLSMHQPYASLLVCGIKVHEGRTWYCHHRGRMWIHAASKATPPEEVEAVEAVYRSRRAGLVFPHHYPASCLLGSVDVTDCLAQEEYRAQFPDGESESPYVLICTNPQELVMKLPMSGDHKVFQLPKDVHKAARKTAKKGPVV